MRGQHARFSRRVGVQILDRDPRMMAKPPPDHTPLSEIKGLEPMCMATFVE